ncbi:MAG: DNA recombination protein RmuC [Candidatus Shapirobacteria bacterium]|nr:DNA recombination protein RmuC [Candidatus Shapirobacteria bacterium]
MVVVYLILGIFVGIVVGMIAITVLSRKNNPDKLSQDFFNRFNEKFPEILNQANTSLITLANQKLTAEKQEISSDLANKKAAIEDLIKRVLEEMKINSQKLEQAESNRVGSFNSLREAIDNNRKITEQLSVTAEALKKVLSNNQLRGAFGEKVAEDLLKMSGFVKGIDYEFNKEQATTETRPDFCIFLPDGAKINVDAKFPYANLQKMTEAESAESKNEYLKLFERDVKDKIRQVCTRDYIDPENKTVDFCILFIPNEMIFSFIYDKLPQVWEEALMKKVVFAGPFSFTAILRMVRQAYDNFSYQKNVQTIIGHIHLFEKEFGKYNDEFLKIGVKIDSLSRQYNEVSSTRTSKLLRVIDKINIEDTASKKQLLD